ncbi:predicted protein [Scheffersomyces stipitis CBS 6054]|uniref:Uncharacterized protein n=1 Tax=Scheffersomyces stipitis (strain ATCC 58785 / CBS 6054 / NBRC 10063 / NRRL Y-11545) TaxID=322104 RepID=A3LP21_PICST|nr:predicted protein [Scheffersomyces stipitis CBS 6054]ABN64413.2 predicted protein [Scheffersomyces stipitis CBS 6054]KAG2735942.1 hypothetical protein G9P44_000032 [Scheffersomyces stipitis]
MSVDRSIAGTPVPVVSEDSVSMFMDPDFNPSNYIDKLFQTITSSSVPSAAYSKASLGKLSYDISQLVTHLDYYTSELSNNNLRQTLQTLNNSNLVILQGNKDDSSEPNLTRLQYYVNVLNNSILTLSGELKSINEDISQSKVNDRSINNESINDLIQLKKVKQNLTSVLHLYEFLSGILSSTSGETKTSYTVEEFQNVLNTSFDSIRNELEAGEKANKQKILAHIDHLVELSGLFVNLKNFQSPFRKYITRLTVLKEENSK